MLKPEQLAGALKKGLAPIYVVAGEETLLIEESVDAIRARARKDGYSERTVLDAAPGFDWNRLEEACASLSLFAERRIVEVRAPKGPNTARRKAAEDSEAGEESASGGNHDGAKLLQKIAAAPPPDTLLIVVCGPLDKRQRESAWCTALSEAGTGVYCWPVKPEELPRWVESRLSAAGLSAEPSALELLVERTEGNLLAAAQDVEKLKLLYPGGKIGEEEVRAAVADSARFDAFDLSAKMLDGDAAGAARSLERLREEGVEAPALIGALAFVVRQWAAAASHYASSRNSAMAVQAAQIWRDKDKYERALRRSAPGLPLGLLRRLAAADRLFKSTGGGDAAWEELLTCVLAAAGQPLSRNERRSS